MNTIGDRMKEYERVFHHNLIRKMPVFIRIDGRAFHTFTRNFKKPFDQNLIDCMVMAADRTAAGMSGFVLGYHQSDEVTFMISDMATNETEAWFDNDLSKIISITAATFTAHFIDLMRQKTCYDIAWDNLPVFDARAWNIPIEEAPNVFIWRQRDWERNSLQMFARSFFSQKELHGKNHSEIHEMLHQKGENWADLDSWIKNGTFFLKGGTRRNEKLDYESLKELIHSQIYDNTHTTTKYDGGSVR